MLSDVAGRDAPGILIVEDDPEIARMLAEHLVGEGMDVRVAGDASAMDAALAERGADVVLLDAMLPGEDGFAACRRLSGAGQPVIMVTALGTEADRVRGLNTGADDYVTKPFSPTETVARIRAVLRRSSRAGKAPGARPVYAFDGWSVDAVRRQARDPEGSLVALSGAEFDVLLALCANAGEVLTRGRLLEMTHAGSAGPDERSVDVHVSRLRQKVEEDPREPLRIRTVRLGGYVFTPAVVRL